MNDKYQRIKGEITAAIASVAGLDAALPQAEQALGDMQVRCYSLWERLLVLRDDQLDPEEQAERGLLAGRLTAVLQGLHSAGTPTGGSVPGTEGSQS